MAENSKLYALDGEAVLDSLGLGQLPVDFALQAFALYYLCVHLIDDIAEDPDKFYSKFSFARTPPGSAELRSSRLSFMVHASMALFDILQADNEFFEQDAKHRLYRQLLGELARTFQYLALDPPPDLAPEGVLEMKQRRVSGAATRACLQIGFGGSTGPLRAVHGPSAAVAAGEAGGTAAPA